MALKSVLEMEVGCWPSSLDYRGLELEIPKADSIKLSHYTLSLYSTWEMGEDSALILTHNNALNGNSEPFNITSLVDESLRSIYVVPRTLFTVDGRIYLRDKMKNSLEEEEIPQKYMENLETITRGAVNLFYGTISQEDLNKLCRQERLW